MSLPLVLIVDDHAGMTETLADILGGTGYAVAGALSGEAAVAMVRETRYDAVLMDIQMPGMNGVEALTAMRTLAPHMPVILMTAYTHHELAEDARRAAFAVLSKPLDLGRTLRLIADVTRPAAGPAGSDP